MRKLADEGLFEPERKRPLPELPQRVGIVGAGAMGRGIAQVSAAAGIHVLITDAEPAAAENGLGSPYKVGDANLDGAVDVSDFNIWNGAKFTSSNGLAAVPEPCGLLLLASGAAGFGMWRRRRNATGHVI